MIQVKKKVRLGFRDWSKNSDKVYTLQLQNDDNVYTVLASYGRRYQYPRTDIKITTSDYGKALKVFDTTMYSKLKKGYEVEAD
jgi:predicted DNA-binding WGR domain protein